MKNSYLKELEELLDLYHMEPSEKLEILEDYNNMYEEGLATGMSDEEIINYLGQPRSNIKDLTEGYKKINLAKTNGNEKIIAISPFFALVTFFILGFGFDLWHPGWMVFLLIPVTAIIVELGSNSQKHMFTSLSPFATGAIYMYLGFYQDLWHPGWLVFLAIPVIAIITERTTMKFLEFLTSLSPFIALILFFYLGEQDLWQEAWLVFLLIPMVGILNEKKIHVLLLSESLLIGGVIAYLYIGYEYSEWGLALFSFVPMIIYSIYTGYISVKIETDDKRMFYISIITVLIFAVVGIISGAWIYVWLMLLAIPVLSILLYAPKETHMVSISPFVAIVIFFLVGMITGYWEYSWLAFLIIPVVAILKEA